MEEIKIHTSIFIIISNIFWFKEIIIFSDQLVKISDFNAIIDKISLDNLIGSRRRNIINEDGKTIKNSDYLQLTKDK